MALLPSADAARDAAIARVADVRALYGRMLSDVAYRIENSALFDHAVAITNDFETALTLWADVTDDTPASEVVRLAAVVKVTFDTARAQAETVGLGHLPERCVPREDGRRASPALPPTRALMGRGPRPRNSSPASSRRCPCTICPP